MSTYSSPDPLQGEPTSSQHPDIQDEYADYHHDAQTTSPLLPAEIPDSQEDYLPDLDLEDTETTDGQEDCFPHVDLDTEAPNSQEDCFPHVDIQDREIPDSQEDPLPYLNTDDRDIPDIQGDLPADLAAGESDVALSSEDTEIIPGGTKLTPNPKYRHLLHERGFNVNGCVPSKAPTYIEDENMEDQATQPATQPFFDPRRQGTKSMLSDQDEADVLCLLLPSSSGAINAMDLVAEYGPQHILQNHYVDGILEADYALQPENKSNARPGKGSDDDGTELDLSTQKVKGEVKGTKKERPARDIALRMSSIVHDPRRGFIFGRNKKLCDLVISGDVMRLSNCHFRIFINQFGVLMLEDTSTNGTYVDKVLLKSAQADHQLPRYPSTRTLTNGSIIDLPILSRETGEHMRFIIKMPSRDRAQHHYNQNLAAYLQYIQQVERQAQVAAKAVGNLPQTRPMPFNVLSRGESENTPNVSILAAATGEFNHGMHWNGGDKYNVVQYIGKGAFAMVYKLSSVENGEVYAAKQIEKRRFIKDGVMGNKVHYEILVMKKLHHPNIVKYIENHDIGTHLFIIMEYVPFGDLTSYTKLSTAMPEFMCQMMAGQISMALNYLHDCKITHRDIKPDNILIASHKPYVFKLSDFGLSKIVNDETFMQTFCGTLLYCAPEIFPGYQRIKMGLNPKRTRSSDLTPERTLPYQPTVDNWGLAAVTYHLLCGYSPWTGTMDNNGATMLWSVMNEPVNWERLRQAGVSDCGIHFLKRILVTDPTYRARDADILVHPWICGVTKAGTMEADPTQIDTTQLGEGVGDDLIMDDGDEQELDASQLSLADRAHHAGSGDSANDGGDPRQSKRFRWESQGWQPPSPFNEDGTLREADDWAGEPLPWGNDYNAWMLAQQEQQQQQEGALPNLTGPNRLFGEISQSALRSSGVMDRNTAHAALGVSFGGASEQSLDELGVEEMDSRPDLTSADAASDTDETSHVTNDGTSQHQLQYPQALPGPAFAVSALSLLGTENLVGQLNMTSPESGVSGPSADSRPASPKTPTSRELSPAITGTKRSSQIFESPEDETTPKRNKTGDPDSAHHSVRQSVRRSSQHKSSATKSHGRESAAKSHGGGSVLKSQTRENKGKSKSPKTPGMSPLVSESSNTQQDQPQNDGQRPKSPNSLPETAINSHGSGQPVATNGITATGAASVPIQSSNSIPTSIVPSTANPDLLLTPVPPVLFGTLTPTHGSIEAPIIHITSRSVSYGRHFFCNFVQAAKDERVPKFALDFVMWYPRIEADIAAGDTNWFTNPNLSCIVLTRATRYVKINNVRLVNRQDCWQYGHLRTGDIITIFEPDEGTRPKSKEGRAFLRYKCEFFVGKSKDMRGEGNDEAFRVEMETEKYAMNLRKMEAGESSGQGVAATKGSVSKSTEDADFAATKGSATKSNNGADLATTKGSATKSNNGADLATTKGSASRSNNTVDITTTKGSVSKSTHTPALATTKGSVSKSTHTPALATTKGSASKSTNTTAATTIKGSGSKSTNTAGSTTTKTSASRNTKSHTGGAL